MDNTVIQFNFDSIEDLADHVSYMADESKRKSTTAKTQRDKQAYLFEYEAYRHIEDLIRSSNLIQGRLVLVDEDLEDARDEVKQAIASVTSIREYLGTTLENLNEKLSELVPDK